MKTLVKILCLCSILFSEVIREEIVSRHLNGNKMMVVTYKGEGMNEKVIKRTIFSEDNQLLSEEFIKDNSNEVTYYYPYSKNISKYENYLNGQLHGQYVSYYENGQINEKRNYINGEPDGEWVGFHPNGNLMYENFFNDRKRVGVWNTYYSNGNHEYIQHFEDDVLVWNIHYYENKNLSYEKKSTKDGDRIFWLEGLEDGSITKWMEYKDDKEHNGFSTLLYEDFLKDKELYTFYFLFLYKDGIKYRDERYFSSETNMVDFYLSCGIYSEIEDILSESTINIVTELPTCDEFIPDEWE
tara:strand:- start:301 stop:1194 length:894 start_codon:yes stop_codon:yes gene_type:complete